MRPCHNWPVISAKWVIFIAAFLALLTANGVSTQSSSRKCSIGIVL